MDNQRSVFPVSGLYLIYISVPITKSIGENFMTELTLPAVTISDAMSGLRSIVASENSVSETDLVFKGITFHFTEKTTGTDLTSGIYEKDFAATRPPHDMQYLDKDGKRVSQKELTEEYER